MRLEKYQIAIPAAAKEVIEARFEELCDRRVRRDVSAQLRMLLVRAHDHRKRVPADEPGDAAFNLQIAGIQRLTARRNRVAVRRASGPQIDAQAVRMFERVSKHERG